MSTKIRPTPCPFSTCCQGHSGRVLNILLSAYQIVDLHIHVAMMMIALPSSPRSAQVYRNCAQSQGKSMAATACRWKPSALSFFELWPWSSKGISPHVQPISNALRRISWSCLIWGTLGTKTMNLLEGLPPSPDRLVWSTCGSPALSLCLAMMICAMLKSKWSERWAGWLRKIQRILRSAQHYVQQLWDALD